jgi:hypothetical protein
MLSPCVMARRDQSARVRAVNRQNSKYFRKNPPLIESAMGFFISSAGVISDPKRTATYYHDNHKY